jgi:hypothetical protein
MALSDAMTPAAREYEISLQFMGPDVGSFPSSAPVGSTAITTLKFNSLRFDGGEELRDFSAGQQLQALERIVKQASGLSGSINLTSNPTFMRLYQTYGPLVTVIVTWDDQTDPGNDTTLTVKGIMRLPSMSFLDNPGTVDFEIRPYGVTPLMTFPA